MKFKDMQNMSKTEREKKMKELKMELVKSKVSGSKTGSSKSKEIRKMIARILTLNNQEGKSSMQRTKPSTSSQKKSAMKEVENKK